MSKLKSVRHSHCNGFKTIEKKNEWKGRRIETERKRDRETKQNAENKNAFTHHSGGNEPHINGR